MEKVKYSQTYFLSKWLHVGVGECTETLLSAGMECRYKISDE